MAKTVFLLTGGTIDSYYDIHSGKALVCDKSVIPHYIEKVFWENKRDHEYVQVCAKDSREINDEDRLMLCQLIDNSKEHHFLITHGSFTLFETARYLDLHVKRKDIKVVLTGAMIPMEGFYHSDGHFNLGMALGGLKLLKEGIHVCFQGEFYTPSETIKLH